MKELNLYIFESNLERASELLKEGKDINGIYGNGIRPIISAINSDNPKMLNFVIEKGADVNIDDGLPLYEAIDYCIDSMIQNNRNEPYPETLEMVEILLENGADLELRNSNGKRPIDVISYYCRNKENFERIKGFFRPVIPEIDELLK